MITEQFPMTIAGDTVATEDNLLTNVEKGATLVRILQKIKLL